LSSGHVKRTGHLSKPPWADKHRRKRPTNKKLEQRILTILGIEEMRNPYTNSRGTITPLQISKQVPDLILHSFDDIQNTMYRMKEKGLLHVVEVKYGTGGSLVYEIEETPFQIAVDGIIQFRKSIRPIARLVINHEEQYQTIVDKTEGDPEVKAELKKVPEKIKDSVEGYSNVKVGLKKIPEKVIKKIEDKVYDTFADSLVNHGFKAAIFVTRLIFSTENAGAELSD
jgi:hypothetical protein